MSDHIKHIRQTHNDYKHLSWCGREIGEIDFLWTFLDIDHAAYSQMNKDRLVPCQKCLKKVVETLYCQIEEKV